MSKTIITICPDCGNPAQIGEEDKNLRRRCDYCGKEFVAYEAETCQCGAPKHPNHKCRKCGSRFMANDLSALRKAVSAIASIPSAGPGGGCDADSGDADVDTASELREISGNSLHPAERTSIGELAALVETNLRAIWEGDEALAKAIPPVMIWGAPGVGKSTAIRELAERLGIGFIDVRLAQREPVDMRGLPVPEDDRVRWLVSSEWPRDPDSRGIIIFDELTAADKTLQVAAYEFILDRRLGDLYQVPKNWYIVAAGNRTEDRAVACSMSSALANRFLHVEIAPQLKDFIAYGEAHDMHPAVLGFLRFRPKLLFSQKQENLQRGWPSPRSWERVSTMLKLADRTGDRKSLQYIVPGLVGTGAATEFFGYYNDLALQGSTLDVKRKLIDGEPLVLPAEPDQAYAMCEAIILFISRETEPKVQFSMFDNFLANSMEWSNDYAAMVLNGIVKGTSRTTRRRKILLSARDLPQWIAKHHLENAACLNVK